MTIKLADLFIIEDSFSTEKHIHSTKVRECKSNYKKVRTRNQYRIVNED